MAILGIVFVFHYRRLSHPTLLGDDLIRVIDARVLPLREQLFRPFAEHVAPGFEVATAALVRPFGDRIDLLPAALTGFAFLTWVLMLCAASWWAARISNRHEAACLIFVFFGVSSACIEVPWWFSAATYSLSAACIFMILGVISGRSHRIFLRFLIVSSGTALAMSFSAIGLLALLLGACASVARFGISRAAGLDLIALGTGFSVSSAIAHSLGGEVVSTESTRLCAAGFAYALATPGGVAMPLFLGIDAHAVTHHFSFAIGIAMTALLFVGLKRSRLSNPIRMDLVAMAIVPYLAIYPTRAGLVESGAWAMPDFLYFWTSRYHLFMTAVLSFASAMAVIRLKDWLEPHRFRLTQCLPVCIVGIYVVSQCHNANLMRHFENQADQADTLTALVRLRRFADSERISIGRLERLLPPVRRGWNASVLELRPDRFPLVRLIERRGEYVGDPVSNSEDDELRQKIVDSIGMRAWRLANANRLSNLDPADHLDISGFRTVEPQEMTFEKSDRHGDLAWVVLEPFGHVEFSLYGLSRRSNVIFENLQADGTVHIQWTTDATWDDSRIAEFDPLPSANCPVPRRIIFRPMDFESADQENPKSFSVRFRLKSTRAGKLRIGRIRVGFMTRNTGDFAIREIQGRSVQVDLPAFAERGRLSIL